MIANRLSQRHRGILRILQDLRWWQKQFFPQLSVAAAAEVKLTLLQTLIFSNLSLLRKQWKRVLLLQIEHFSQKQFHRRDAENADEKRNMRLLRYMLSE